MEKKQTAILQHCYSGAVLNGWAMTSVSVLSPLVPQTNFFQRNLTCGMKI